MIKKFDQFVKTNEEFEGGPERAPSPAPSRPDRDVEIAPSRPAVSPGQKPSRPSVVPSKKPGVEPAPLAHFQEDEQAEDEYIGTVKMKQLANELGVDFSGNSLNYNGQKVEFYSETEKFHIGKNKFKEVEEVVNFLNADKNLDRPEYKLGDRVDPEYEAKSYKFSRRNRLR